MEKRSHEDPAPELPGEGTVPAAEEAPASTEEAPAPAQEAPDPAPAEVAPEEAAPDPAPVEVAPEEAAPDPTEAEAPAPPAKAAAERAPVEPRKGKRIRGRIIQLGEQGVFVDFGGREEGHLDPREIQDPEGAFTKAIGDEISATVLSVDGGVKLTLKGRRPGNLPALLEAHASGAPVEGKITGVNKGGLVVRAMGVRAFCPFSQIDRHYIDNPEHYIGKRLSFRVSGADEKGRNVVLSRRALLEEEAKEMAEGVRKTLEVGAELPGKVARLRPFGAFVDLGGVDGLVHVSEISHTRVKHPSETLEVGQEVRVRVVKVEDLGGAQERISLSIKQLQADPWEAATAELNAGDRIQGKVVRVVEFGAFVEITPGVDGLVHVSALAEGRVEHPSEVVSPGDTVDAWVVQVERGKRRISLSLMEPGTSSHRPEPSRRREPRPQRMQPQKEPEDGLTSMGEAFQRLRDRMQGG